jgi:hypothetical protein
MRSAIKYDNILSIPMGYALASPMLQEKVGRVGGALA